MMSLATTINAADYYLQKDFAEIAGKNYPSIGMILGQQISGENSLTAVRRVFLDTIKEAATSEPEKSYFAAQMACHVISADRTLAVEYLNKWYDNGLLPLLTNALYMPPHKSISMLRNSKTMTPDGIERFFGIAATLTSADVKNPDEVKALLFREGAYALKNCASNWRQRDGLVENLQELFNSDALTIVDLLVTNKSSNAVFDITKISALGFFFAHAVFARPGNTETLATIKQAMAYLRTEALDPANDPSATNTPEHRNEWYAKRIGTLISSMTIGFCKATADLTKTEKQREAAIKFLCSIIQEAVPTPKFFMASTIKSVVFDTAQQMISAYASKDLNEAKVQMKQLLAVFYQAVLCDIEEKDEQNDTYVELSIKNEAVWEKMFYDVYNGS
ncbi:MAG: hypothetical protein JW841_02940 [Deltaproteobacteria bacterium]|nr:hypothetical protein [Deltaproteobacteria bacterium]